MSDSFQNKPILYEHFVNFLKEKKEKSFEAWMSELHEGYGKDYTHRLIRLISELKPDAGTRPSDIYELLHTDFYNYCFHMNIFKSMTNKQEHAMIEELVGKLADYIIEEFRHMALSSVLYDEGPDEPEPMMQKNAVAPTPASKGAASKASPSSTFKKPSPAKTPSVKASHEQKTTEEKRISPEKRKSKAQPAFQTQEFEKSVKDYLTKHAHLKMEPNEEGVLDNILAEYHTHHNINAIENESHRWKTRLLPLLGNKTIKANQHFIEFMTAMHAVEEQSRPGKKHS